MTDTCAAACTVRRIICSDIPGLHEFDCMQHLRNVWIGSTEKALTSELNNILCVSLEEIDPRIWVSSYISAVIHAVDKEFSDNTNVEIRSLSVVKHVNNNIMSTALMG